MPGLRSLLRTALPAVLAALLPLSTTAATAPVNDPALIAAAKREGTATFYVAMEPKQLEAMMARFEATYGFKIQFLRLESDKLPPRVITEDRGGLHNVDAVACPGLQIDLLKRTGLLAPLKAPENRDLLAGTYDPEGYWSGVYLDMESIAYNPIRLKAAGLKPPKTWDDFAAKEWRGQFSLYATGFEWYAALKKFYGKAHTDALLRALAANQPRLVTGHTLAISLAVSGEVLATVNTFSYSALLSKDSGAPIELVNPNPTIIEPFDVAVMKTAPHPNAARLLARWLLSRDTQIWIRDQLHRAVARKDIKNDARMLDPKVRYVVSDPATITPQDRTDFDALLNKPV
jgi:iron(III) transport system substrate-binding protein